MTNDKEAAKGSDIIILAVKPWIVETVLEEILFKTTNTYICSCRYNVRTIRQIFGRPYYDVPHHPQYSYLIGMQYDTYCKP